MAISDLYSQTLSALTATRATMLSPDWQATLDGESSALRLQASQELVQVQKAISALSNAALSDIATQMSAQQGDLQADTKALTAALQDIQDVQNVVTTVTNILTTVAKIVPLI